VVVRELEPHRERNLQNMKPLTLLKLHFPEGPSFHSLLFWTPVPVRGDERGRGGVVEGEVAKSPWS
jgi:hypothetical protein